MCSISAMPGNGPRFRSAEGSELAGHCRWATHPPSAVSDRPKADGCQWRLTGSL